VALAGGGAVRCGAVRLRVAVRCGAVRGPEPIASRQTVLAHAPRVSWRSFFDRWLTTIAL
jgi:hypothetical protein